MASRAFAVALLGMPGQTLSKQIQARAKKEGAAIFFADEASVRTNYHAGTTWAPVGQTPVVAASGRTRSVSMVSAVSPRGELHFQVYEEGIRKEEFLEFCKMLIEDMNRPVFLIMDNSQVHRSKILKEYDTSATVGPEARNLRFP